MVTEPDADRKSFADEDKLTNGPLPNELPELEFWRERKKKSAWAVFIVALLGIFALFSPVTTLVYLVVFFATAIYAGYAQNKYYYWFEENELANGANLIEMERKLEDEKEKDRYYDAGG